MKKIIFVLIALPLAANAAEPATSCGNGYITIDEPNIIVATSCPTGYLNVGTADSCLATSPSGSCIMYVPVGMSLTDTTGTYEYTAPCAME